MLSSLLNEFPLDRRQFELTDQQIHSEENLASYFQTSELAATSILTSGILLSELCQALGYAMPCPSVDRRLASFWFNTSFSAINWTAPPMWDTIAGNYQGRDGWIRLHTNARHHRKAALRALGCDDDPASVRDAIASWYVEALESAIIAEKGCAAAMHSATEWQKHPAGIAVKSEPLIRWDRSYGNIAQYDYSSRVRPLAGIRILDLTRVLAGPTATRFLAGFGADVLRIDPPQWDDSALEVEMTLGKRCAALDLNQSADRDRFAQLLAKCDVLVHGYRADALDNLGFDHDKRRLINSELIDVALSAYGWTGPWRNRRGFDSLVQMSCGIAQSGMTRSRSDKPTPLPVQALDYATGYLMAAAVLYALAERVRSGTILSARLSLARTAAFLMEYPTHSYPQGTTINVAGDADYLPSLETTHHGDIKRLVFPLRWKALEPRWDYPVTALRKHEASWDVL